MKVPKVVARFSKAPSDPAELRRVARSLGSELPHKRVETLREFRAALVKTPIAESQDETLLDRTSYAAGYVDSMMDVTAEYESMVAFGESRQELSADVVRGIQIAVQLFHHISTSSYASEAAFTAIASGILGSDPLIAAQAVDIWSHESYAAGLISDPYATTASAASVPTPVMAAGSVPTAVPEELLWAQEPSAHDDAVGSRPSTLRAITEPLAEAAELLPVERELLSS